MYPTATRMAITNPMMLYFRRGLSPLGRRGTALLIAAGAWAVDRATCVTPGASFAPADFAGSFAKAGAGDAVIGRWI
jgi:hypothetical protein